MIDATAITECNHVFCKSCIVKHFNSLSKNNNNCPICNIYVAQPEKSFQSDNTLQEVRFIFILIVITFQNRGLFENSKIHDLCFFKQLILRKKNPINKHKVSLCKKLMSFWIILVNLDFCKWNKEVNNSKFCTTKKKVQND